MADATSGNVTGGGASSTGGNLAGDIGSLIGALTPTATGIYSAGQARKEYGQAASTLAGLGQPYVEAGKKQLDTALSGALTPAQQAQADLYGTQAKTLYGQATPFISAGTYDITQSQAGQLPQWQQQQLENEKAAAIARATSTLGPNVDSTTLGNVINNINAQFDIQRGNLMQQNLATGESLFNLGVGVQTQGMQAEQAAANVPVAAAQTAFANALNLEAGGNQPVEASVQTMLAGDQLIAQQLRDFMTAMSPTAVGGGGILTDITNIFKDLFPSSSSGSTDNSGTPA